MTLSAKEVNELKHAPAVEGVLPEVLNRWSPRSFADREVSPSDLAKILEAARWAPSSYNEQPWRFIVAIRGSETYNKMVATMVEFNRTWASAAPVLILGIASTKFAQNGTQNYYALYDLGAAAALLSLQANALHLATHQMAGFDKEAARKAFDIPEDFTPGSIIALGYQGEPSALANKQLVAMETSPRERKPLSEIALSAWGVAAKLG